MSTVIRNKHDTIYIDRKKLEELKILAQKDPNKRARICLHKDDGEMIQEMIIAFCKDSYIRPHRHTDKSESYHIIEGRIEIIFYNDILYNQIVDQIDIEWEQDSVLILAPKDQYSSIAPLGFNQYNRHSVEYFTKIYSSFKKDIQAILCPESQKNIVENSTICFS